MRQMLVIHAVVLGLLGSCWVGAAPASQVAAPQPNRPYAAGAVAPGASQVIPVVPPPPAPSPAPPRKLKWTQKMKRQARRTVKAVGRLGHDMLVGAAAGVGVAVGIGLIVLAASLENEDGQ